MKNTYMPKIINDKYYTPNDLANYIVNKTKEIIGEENISEYLEPSAGNGVFLDYLPDNTLAYDIEPEDKYNRIIKQDYLALDLGYKKGRCIIGNPPFGRSCNLAVAFYKKSIIICDYIIFILPISQLNNNNRFYEFDLIYSENLGKRIYTDREIHCCFNIYKRPNDRLFNSKPNYKLKDIEIFEHHNKRHYISKSNINYDIRICAWGAGIGKEVFTENEYALEYCIKIKNNTYKEKIIELIKNANWIEEYKMTATPNLLHWQIYKYLKEQIPELE